MYGCLGGLVEGEQNTDLGLFAIHEQELRLHDCRRSEARNLIRAGVSETVAQKITGHKTRSVFDRYNITSDGDIREAAEKVVEHQKIVQDKILPLQREA